VLACECGALLILLLMTTCVFFVPSWLNFEWCGRRAREGEPVGGVFRRWGSAALPVSDFFKKEAKHLCLSGCGLSGKLSAVGKSFWFFFSKKNALLPFAFVRRLTCRHPGPTLMHRGRYA
jgi:hypothetical protein